MVRPYGEFVKLAGLSVTLILLQSKSDFSVTTMANTPKCQLSKLARKRGRRRRRRRTTTTTTTTTITTTTTTTTTTATTAKTRIKKNHDWQQHK